MPGVKGSLRWNGTVYAATVKRFMRNEAPYIKLLGKLFLDENPLPLDFALEDGCPDGPVDAVHTLKGVAGILAWPRRTKFLARLWNRFAPVSHKPIIRSCMEPL